MVPRPPLSNWIISRRTNHGPPWSIWIGTGVFLKRVYASGLGLRPRPSPMTRIYFVKDYSISSVWFRFDVCNYQNVTTVVNGILCFSWRMMGSFSFVAVQFQGIFTKWHRIQMKPLLWQKWNNNSNIQGLIDLLLHQFQMTRLIVNNLKIFLFMSKYANRGFANPKWIMKNVIF